MAKFMGTLTRSASEVGLVEMLTPRASEVGLVEMLTRSASEVGLVLSVSNVMDCSLKSLIVVDPSSAAAFRPPLFSYGWIVSSETPSSRLEILQSARRPSLELYLHPFRFNWCRDDDMKVISSAIHNVELPASDPTVVGNCLLDEPALFGVHKASPLRHRSLTSRDRTPPRDGMDVTCPPRRLSENT